MIKNFLKLFTKNKENDIIIGGNTETIIINL